MKNNQNKAGVPSPALMEKGIKGMRILFFLLLLIFPSHADSIWTKETASPYSTDKALKVGDIINVIVAESTSAQNQAGTKSDVKDDLALKLTNTIQRLAPILGTNSQIDGQASNRYAGTG